ncbi:hypothetical protein CORT_0A05820 [Candida orthopsilosis Co 90-125]|uniref:Uncharacterized protein n=1 Tax=Candida orthopsilosis (strain 90-125) TaxID=1136231 RepID=H8WY22_CANO9|nr:hypothetical protein CORT_0A05820 [Candida orthopsilosis Co 90-125]CCG20969.1 hypothetical protein CORT_0A05820 [Candida orthopsilosis Co 90-125]
MLGSIAYTPYFVLLLLSTTVDAWYDPPTILSYEKGLSCSRVERSSKLEDAYITFHVDLMIADLKIPGLIFHYPDIVNFSSIPTIEEVNQLYPKEKKRLYKRSLTEDGKFNLEAAEGYTVDESKLWTGIVDKDTKFNIPQSGIYCAYIAPDNKNQANFNLPIVFKNHYGSLSLRNYVFYSQLKFLVPISVVIFVALHRFIKVGKGSTTRNSISFISNQVIFAILVPFTVLHFYTLIVYWIKNNFYDSSQNTYITCILYTTAQLADSAFNSFTSYAIVLFAMGYGTIYYHSEKTGQYRLFPQGSLINLNLFLAGDIVLSYFTEIHSQRHSRSYGDDFNGKTTIIQISFVSIIIRIVSIFIDFVWLILPFTFYFRTKKDIATSPPITPDAKDNDKVLSSCKKTFIVIFLSTIIKAMSFAVISLLVALIGGYNLPSFPEDTDRGLVYQSALRVMMDEQESPLRWGKIWLRWIQLLVLVVSISSFWSEIRLY